MPKAKKTKVEGGQPAGKGPGRPKLPSLEQIAARLDEPSCSTAPPPTSSETTAPLRAYSARAPQARGRNFLV